MFSPARPPLMWSRVAIILAVTAGFCSRVWTVAQTFTLEVASARAAINIWLSSAYFQCSVIPPKPFHFAMAMMKSRPMSSASRAISRFRP